MSSLLEDRYRRALRVLPAYYRDAWEEDMVATFLEASYAAHPDDPEGVEMSSPSRSERASILRLAVRLRLGGPDAAPRHFVWGEAVRRVALVGLFGNAVTVLAGVAFSFWLANGLPGVEIPADAPPAEQTNRLYAVLELASLLWLPAFLCLIYGRRKATWVLALVAFAPQVVTFVFLALDGVEVGNGYVSVSSVYQLVFGAVPVLALAAFHRAAPPVRPRPWLLALPLGVVVAFLLQAISLPPTDRPPFLDWPAQWCVGVIAGSLVLLAAALARRSPATPQWALALALLAAAVFGLRVVTLVDYLRVTEPAQMHPAWVTAAAVEAAAVLVVGLILAVVAGRALRRLPATPPDARPTAEAAQDPSAPPPDHQTV